MLPRLHPGRPAILGQLCGRHQHIQYATLPAMSPIRRLAFLFPILVPFLFPSNPAIHLNHRLTHPFRTLSQSIPAHLEISVSDHLLMYMRYITAFATIMTKTRPFQCKYSITKPSHYGQCHRLLTLPRTPWNMKATSTAETRQHSLKRCLAARSADACTSVCSEILTIASR
jgi:hypothetical protein